MPLIRVQAASRSYDVLVEPGSLPALGSHTRTAIPHATRAFLAFDANLPSATIETARASLLAAGFSCDSLALRAEETHKSLASVESLLLSMTAAKLTRRDAIVALGGGIIGDITGFAAAIYRRGVPFLQVPTTLLSMVDASVGGKTGVNLRVASSTSPTSDASLKKNFVGSFHQPHFVLIDPILLDSLPLRQFTSGLAECIKHGLLAGSHLDPDLLNFTTTHAPKILARDRASLTDFIARNVAVKAHVVAGDEREEDESTSGGRAQLNLGHTFGHAIETIPSAHPAGHPNLAPLHHGEAVALGLLAASTCAAQLNLVSHAHTDRLRALLTTLGLPTKAGGLPSTDHILTLMSHDKKVLGSHLRLVLPTSDTTVAIIENPDPSAVRAGIEAIRG